MQKQFAVLAAIAAGLLACPAGAPARLLDNWPYERLFKEADLIVFATAKKTEAADDQPPPHSWAREFVAQNTAFKVNHVVKGKAGKQIKVLHFKFGELKMGLRPGTADVIIENGPLLVAFRTDPVIVTVEDEDRKTVLRTPEYLLFLRQMKDGRYEPVSGRIDPAQSVREVSAPQDRVLGGK